MSSALDPDPRLARRRLRAGAALVLLLVALGIAVLVTALAPRGASATIEPGPEATEPIEELGGVVYVHVLGRVARPGLYSLPDGSRAVDVIAAAGGFAEGADPGAVNLARLLVDGEQLYVPEAGEAVAGAASPAAVSGAAGGRVNLNTADAAALDTLPRIGPALAARIISWRDANGRFAAVEDLLAVSGIGESTLDGLRDLVTV